MDAVWGFFSGATTYAINSPEVDRLYTRLWTDTKTGR